MRILAGEFSGRRLASPHDRGTRPMLARVRESLFAILGGVIEDASVLDLFSGTGSLGLEALSRGAARVRCFERDRRAAARLAENVEALGVGERVAIVRGDALDARRWNPSGSAGEPWADVVLCDPPYPMFQDGGGRERVIEALGRLVERELRAGGVLVLHTHPRVRLEGDLPAEVECDRREYGNTALWFLWKPALGEDGE